MMNMLESFLQNMPEQQVPKVSKLGVMRLIILKLMKFYESNSKGRSK